SQDAEDLSDLHFLRDSPRGPCRVLDEVSPPCDTAPHGIAELSSVSADLGHVPGEDQIGYALSQHPAKLAPYARKPRLRSAAGPWGGGTVPASPTENATAISAVSPRSTAIVRTTHVPPRPSSHLARPAAEVGCPGVVGGAVLSCVGLPPSYIGGNPAVLM